MKKKPNIVFILADDLGWNDLAIQGSTYYESPHLDRLAGMGMRFTRGYAPCQVCSPSRASILTGKYTPRHGITDYIGAPSGTDWRRAGRCSKLLPADYEHGLRADEVTFAEALRRSGYRTFYAGKWHCGGEGAWPENFGFEVNKGGWSAGQPDSYFSPWENPRLPPGDPGESLPLRLGRETAEFITAHKAEPFLAFLSFYSVHSPLQTTRERWAKYRAKALEQGVPDHRFVMDRTLPVRQVQDCPVYAGMIEAMDEAVGMVLDALEAQGLAEDTIICFTSDNGGVSSGDAYSSSMLPLRGGKGRQWEGGIREPFYVAWPGKIPAGTTCDVPVSGIDFYPTFLDLAGVPLPTEQTVDGLSLASLLRGEADPALADRDLFWHYPHYGNQGGEPSSIIQRTPWKLIHYYEDGRDELYHLDDDPGEQHDLAAAQADRVATLRCCLDQWLHDTGARFPEPDPDYDPDKAAERLRRIEREEMPRLETNHARFLHPDWEPNPDWWGSQIVRD